MKLKSLFGILLCFLTGKVMAQDTLIVKEDSVPVKKTKFVFAFDARFSSIHQQSVKINGFKLGWERYERNRYGVGLYSLGDPIRIDNEHTEVYNLDGVDTDTLELYSDLSYVVIFWDHILTSKKRYEISLNMELGSGSAELGYLDESSGNGVIRRLDEVPFGVLEFSVAGHYKILPWIGPGAGLGYRMVFASDKNVNRSFSSPIGILKVKVFLGPLYRAVFKPKQKEKEKKEN